MIFRVRQASVTLGTHDCLWLISVANIVEICVVDFSVFVQYLHPPSAAPIRPQKQPAAAWTLNCHDPRFPVSESRFSTTHHRREATRPRPHSSDASVASTALKIVPEGISGVSFLVGDTQRIVSPSSGERKEQPAGGEVSVVDVNSPSPSPHPPSSPVPRSRTH